MDRINRARELRRMIEHNAHGMEPARMAEYPELFPEWQGDGRLCEAGKILRYEGELFKVLLTHATQPEWTPLDAPSLFAKLLTDPTGESILPWVQPDSTNPYAQGDKVTHGGKTWESEIDGNVWEPGVYGWAEVTE